MDCQTDADMLHIYRRKKGLTQKKLAWLVQCDESFISQLETGRIRANHSMGQRISAALGYPPGKVFPTLFPPGSYDLRGEPVIRSTPIKEMPLNATESAFRAWRENEGGMTNDQCRIVSEQMGIALHRMFPERFDRLGNEIKPTTK